MSQNRKLIYTARVHMTQVALLSNFGPELECAPAGGQILVI